MTVLVDDPRIEQRLIAERRASGTDQHDEVWEGVYFMAPMANNEHQDLVGEFVYVLKDAFGRQHHARIEPGANLAGSAEDWEHDYRAPDVVVFLKDTGARDCESHWRGGADFVVEITSPGDRTREKIPFYSQVGVRELLIVDRETWKLELYRRRGERLELVGESAVAGGRVAESEVLPLRFRLLPGGARPRIEVTHAASQREWLI